MSEGLGGAVVGEAAFVFRGIWKDFLSRDGSRICVLEDVSLHGRSGGITCILGPTGSGKSTLLRIAAGLEVPDSGEVMVGGSPPGELPGRIGYLSQRHTLLPWLRVRDNVGLPLEIRGVEPEARDVRVRDICAMLGLEGAGGLYSHELSGGMQQRASLGRLLAAEAPYWLLDEPFAALDERTIHRLQRLLLEIVESSGVSVLFVTHSIDEAVFLADRIVVFSASPGRVVGVFELSMPHPRDRLSPEYGRLLEDIRQQLESVLKEP